MVAIRRPHNHKSDNVKPQEEEGNLSKSSSAASASAAAGTEEAAAASFVTPAKQIRARNTARGSSEKKDSDGSKFSSAAGASSAQRSLATTDKKKHQQPSDKNTTKSTRQQQRRTAQQDDDDDDDDAADGGGADAPSASTPSLVQCWQDTPPPLPNPTQQQQQHMLLTTVEKKNANLMKTTKKDKKTSSSGDDFCDLSSLRSLEEKQAVTFDEIAVAQLPVLVRLPPPPPAVTDKHQSAKKKKNTSKHQAAEGAAKGDDDDTSSPLHKAHRPDGHQTATAAAAAGGAVEDRVGHLLRRLQLRAFVLACIDYIYSRSFGGGGSGGSSSGGLGLKQVTTHLAVAILLRFIAKKEQQPMDNSNDNAASATAAASSSLFESCLAELATAMQKKLKKKSAKKTSQAKNGGDKARVPLDPLSTAVDAEVDHLLAAIGGHLACSTDSKDADSAVSALAASFVAIHEPGGPLQQRAKLLCNLCCLVAAKMEEVEILMTPSSVAKTCQMKMADVCNAERMVTQQLAYRLNIVTPASALNTLFVVGRCSKVEQQWASFACDVSLFFPGPLEEQEEDDANNNNNNQQQQQNFAPTLVASAAVFLARFLVRKMAATASASADDDSSSALATRSLAVWGDELQRATATDLECGGHLHRCVVRLLSAVRRSRVRCPMLWRRYASTSNGSIVAPFMSGAAFNALWSDGDGNDGGIAALFQHLSSKLPAAQEEALFSHDETPEAAADAVSRSLGDKMAKAANKKTKKAHPPKKRARN